MFKKKPQVSSRPIQARRKPLTTPQIKPLAPLRSSDRRKTADQIISDLGLEVPPENPENPEDKAAATAERTSLRNSILPDNTLSARFTTTAGPDLKQVSGTVYVGAHNGEDQRILWFRVHDRMYPTVYTLWKNPAIVPLLHTTSDVVSKLQGGADLMTPGLARGPPFPAKARKGAVVAVASMDRPSVPLVVGTAEIDICDLRQVQGTKGHAVENMHWAGDELWTWSPAGRPGGEPPDSIDGWLEEKEEGGVDDLQQRTGQLEIGGDGEESGGVRLEGENKVEEPPAEPVDGEPPPPQVAAEVKELTPKEIDAAFRNAFLYGVHHYKQTNKDVKNYGLEFPLSQSFVMSQLVQPFLPAYTAQQAQQLQIKRTSWKNIKKFIRSLDKEMIIKSKERDGNEVVIFDIDFEDRHILNFTPYPLPKKETTAGTSAGRGAKATEQVDSSADPSVGQTLKVLTLYKPSQKLAPLFDASSASPHAFYSAADLRPVVSAYVEKEQLINEKSKRLVDLDPVLANTLFDAGKEQDAAILQRGSVQRDVLVERILAVCAPWHAIVRNPDTGSSEGAFGGGKPKAGLPPKVLVTLETRSGNKTVTKISGLEAFHVSPQPLADELRKVCAGSTSVDQLVGSSKSNPVMEVMVQGPQKDAVIKALERRGLDRRWVEVVDKTKGKKK